MLKREKRNVIRISCLESSVLWDNYSRYRHSLRNQRLCFSLELLPVALISERIIFDDLIFHDMIY